VARPSRIALFALAALLLAGGAAAWYRIHSSRRFFDQRNLLSRFPAEDALAMSIDVSALRSAGLLQQSATATEPEYKQFVDSTGFDYRRDLDSLVSSFSRSGTYFIARGRFNWTKLRNYAALQGGSCYQDLCRVQGSRPERHISFLPLRNDALALAVSTNDLAATALTKIGQPVTGDIPTAPAWILVPGTELRRQDALPPEMHLVLSALSSADRVVITFGPSAGATGPIIEAQLQATCRTQADAGILVSQLRSTTALLKDALLRDKNRSNDEFATALTAGRFDQNDRRVTAHWPVGKGFIDALTAGI
jgi:hypothetical protein